MSFMDKMRNGSSRLWAIVIAAMLFSMVPLTVATAQDAGEFAEDTFNTIDDITGPVEDTVHRGELATDEDGDPQDVELPGLKGETTTVAHEQTGVSDSVTVGNENVSASAGYTAGVDSSVTIGENGGEAEFTAGLAAELEAVAKASAGDENLGGSVEAGAKVEALIGAKGKIGAYIDETGITIGLDASAGAYVSASAEVSAEVHFFGVQAKVRVFGEAHVGAMAHLSAVVQIGFDGQIKFGLSAGVAALIGASAGIEIEVNASQLIERLGLADMSKLIEWLDQFIQDPGAMIKELVTEKIGQAIDKFTQQISALGEDLANSALQWMGFSGNDGGGAAAATATQETGVAQPDDGPPWTIGDPGDGNFDGADKYDRQLSDFGK